MVQIMFNVIGHEFNMIKITQTPLNAIYTCTPEFFIHPSAIHTPNSLAAPFSLWPETTPSQTHSPGRLHPTDDPVVSHIDLAQTRPCTAVSPSHSFLISCLSKTARRGHSTCLAHAVHRSDLHPRLYVPTASRVPRRVPGAASHAVAAVHRPSKLLSRALLSPWLLLRRAEPLRVSWLR